MEDWSLYDAIVDFADRTFDDYYIKNDELIPDYCPYCEGGASGDRYTFAISLETGAWNCKRGKCGESGTFRKLIDDFAKGLHYNVKMENEKMTMIKQYDCPDESILHPLTEKAINYFATRKISEDTLNAFKVSCDENGNIVFPFYRDDKLTFVKFRVPEKHIKGSGKPKEWAKSNTEPILFGMDNVSFDDKLYITEGMIDALSLYEAGVTNVVSVPSGCENLEWLNICEDWLSNFEEIVIFGDNDDPGVKMQMAVMRRLGEDVCMLPPEYPEFIWNGKDYNRLCKDANEILFIYGPKVLKQIADECEPAPIEGMINLGKVKYEDPFVQPRITTGIPDLDNMTGGFGYGDLVILSGKRGSGKSTITGGFMLNAMNQGINVAAYSGELSTSNFMNWLALQATERKYIEYKTNQQTMKNYAVISDDIRQRVQEWFDGKIWLFDNTADMGELPEDTIIRKFRACAKRNHCKMFLVDNLMTLTAGREDEYAAQTRIVIALKKFAVQYNVVVLLVCHPRKIKQDAIATNDDVAGSANITNAADTVLNVEKPNVRILKNRAFGECGIVYCDYDPTNRRIYQSNVGDLVVYGWDHEGVAEPRYPAASLKEFAIIHNTDQPI